MYKDSEGESYLSIDEARLYLDDDNAIKKSKRLFVHYKGWAIPHWESDKLLRCDLTKIPRFELKLEDDVEEKSSDDLPNIEDIIANESYVYIDAIQPIKKDLLREFWRCEQADGGFFINGLFKLHDGKVNGVDWTNHIAPYAKPYDNLYSDKGLLLKDNINFELERVLTKADVCAKQSDLDTLSELYGIPRKEKQPRQKAQKQRNNQLHDLLWKIYTYLDEQDNPPTAQDVWNELIVNHKKHDTEEIIQEVTPDMIYWESFYCSENALKRSSFNKTLSIIKKKRQTCKDLPINLPVRKTFTG